MVRMIRRGIVLMMSANNPSSHPVPARPFLKWAGGKRQLLGPLTERLPADWQRYHEPFIGGGALFFALRPEVAFLGDANLRLIQTYRGVRSQVDDVIEHLRRYQEQHCREFFEQMRQTEIEGAPDEEVAAWLIYLNRTAFNGLYRVNSRGQFNVPFGRYANPTICDEVTLRACSAQLQHAELACEDFAGVLDRAQPGDLVYFDPPYAPLSATANFTGYTRDGFGLDDQTRLRDVARTLKEKGVRVLISNSSANEIRRLYRDGFQIDEVPATRKINSRASGRGAVPELIIW